MQKYHYMDLYLIKPACCYENQITSVFWKMTVLQVLHWVCWAYYELVMAYEHQVVNLTCYYMFHLSNCICFKAWCMANHFSYFCLSCPCRSAVDLISSNIIFIPPKLLHPEFDAALKNNLPPFCNSRKIITRIHLWLNQHAAMNTKYIP